MRAFTVIVLVILVIGVSVAQVGATPKVQTVAARYTPADSGKAMFDAYCASCHGLDGKGTGPAAAAMRSGVPDITRLAKSHGSFPAFHVTKEIVGDTKSPAHGSKDMPVWGPVFSSLIQQSTGEIQQRAPNLTAYVESPQQK